MPKASTRFRTRKINFKSQIQIYVGSLDNPFEDDYGTFASAAHSPGGAGAGGIHGFPGTPSASGGFGGGIGGGAGAENGDETIRVETGVDKEEEGELHLQAVISASAAALQRSTRGGPGANGTANGSGKGAAAVAHIPTPDATGLAKDYEALYRRNAYVDPQSYIRFSDTVEETMGVAYTMDEDDEDFLIDHNVRAARANKMAQGSPASTTGTAPSSRPASPSSAVNGRLPSMAAASLQHDDQLPTADTSLISLQGHYPRIHHINGLKLPRPPRNKDKSKDAAAASNPLISEDDFELIMDLFERITDRKTPTLHLDVSRIPTLEDMEPSFPTYLPPWSLRSARTLSRVIYPHWKSRRLGAGGKNILPQLDYDITNETPYVCFRRREVKFARKTRRTDTQTVDRLVRLRSDLSSAQELLLKVLDRERCKREAILADARIFEGRIRMREMKRKLGEGAGDEAILIARKEKKRRRDELQQGMPGTTKIVLPNRATLTPLTPGLLPEALPLYKDRTVNATQRVERDMQRKREQEVGWEDLTDTAYAPLPAPMPSRYWRVAERRDGLPEEALKAPSHRIVFERDSAPFVQSIGHRYRKRMGRGGRIHLDRLSLRSVRPPDENDEEDRLFLSRQQERWRYDSDVITELSAHLGPMVVDDFDTKYSAARSCLVTQADLDSLGPNLVYIDDAMRWTAKEPDRLPPIQVLGKLPGQQRSHPAGNGGMGMGMNLGGGGGFPNGMNGGLSNSVTANMASQMYAAANRAMGVAQAQANSVAAQQQQQQLRRASSGTPNPGSQQQQPVQQQSAQALPPLLPSAQQLGMPQPPQIRRLMWENGA